MKAILIATLALAAQATFASDFDNQKIIENARQYKVLKAKYKKMGGSLTCRDFVIAATTDLNATLPDYNMVVNTVVANCSADVNDGMDPIQMRLIALVTETENAGKIESATAESVVLVTPPQPD